MTSPLATFLELQCQTSHSLPINSYLSAHLLFYSHFSKSFMPPRFSLNWHTDSCRWVIMLIFFISLFIHFQLLSIILIMKHKLPLLFAFLLSSPCICLIHGYISPSFSVYRVWTGNFSKPVDFDQAALRWIIYEMWFFNLIFHTALLHYNASIRFLFHVLQKVYFIAIQFVSLDITVTRTFMFSLVIQINLGFTKTRFCFFYSFIK